MLLELQVFTPIRGGHNWLNQLHNKKSFSDFFYFLFVNWAGQMSAGQTGPKKSKIKSYKFLTFFIE